MVEHDFICSDSFESSGIVEWNSPSNIALIKYWGKKQNQIPQNPSISFTLSKCYTNTVVKFKPKKNAQNEIYFTFEGKENQDFEKKVYSYIKSINKYFGFLKNHDLFINSKNNFPHSSGIASSASSMSALASCIVDIESQITNNDNNFNLKKKSFISRLGSGSASRSIEGPVTLWGKTDAFKESSDLYAVNISNEVDKIFHDFNNTILIINPEQKVISSSLGHELMNKNPFSNKRFEIAKNNTERIKDILKSGELDDFITITESEALMIHSLMLSSAPYYIMMKPNTLEAIYKVLEFRRETKLHLCFTLDAGSNVHLLYPKSETEIITKFIDNELLMLCKSNSCIHDHLGYGSVKIR
ncbi:MAG: diphosphomevalonate decarboxylase [Flavobacteriaceae bacterium]|nr:diphosphomevalonate decarboxylase [Flavobacteriaceae bacterium]